MRRFRVAAPARRRTSSSSTMSASSRLAGDGNAADDLKTGYGRKPPLDDTGQLPAVSLYVHAAKVLVTARSTRGDRLDERYCWTDRPPLLEPPPTGGSTPGLSGTLIPGLFIDGPFIDGPDGPPPGPGSQLMHGGEGRPARREPPRRPLAAQTARCRPQRPRHERNISFSFTTTTQRFRDLTLTGSAQPHHPGRRTLVELDDVRCVTAESR